MQKICYVLAQLAEIAYLDGPEARTRGQALGYQGHRFFELDGAQCHAFWSDSEYILAFRGTEPTELTDVLADLNAIPRGAMTHGLVHSGFRGECDKIWDMIETHRNKTHRAKTLYICGHSLGAAMATIATSRFEEYTSVELLATFGSPRVGTRAFVRAIQTPHLRFVNNNDIVTKVPLAIMGYKHHGELKYINFYGHIRKLTIWQAIKDRIRGYRSGLLDGAADHGMHNYVKALENSDGDI